MKKEQIGILYASTYCQFSVVERKLKTLSENQLVLFNQQEKILEKLDGLDKALKRFS